MSSVRSFEDLIVWQKARQLVNNVYFLTRQQTFSRDYSLIDQIRRASVSVMSNIAEGFERGGKEEVIQFLYIAKASCGEVRTQLYIAFDQNYIPENEFKNIIILCKEVSRLIFYFIQSIKVSKYQGLKFKDRSKEQIVLDKLRKEHPNLNF